MQNDGYLTGCEDISMTRRERLQKRKSDFDFYQFLYIAKKL